uniref:Uncharacterized protein n=1 Tax=Anguilla anguilla TaxID=7936 RepID=A0A0E9T716_ANGAN
MMKFNCITALFLICDGSF